MEFAKNVLISVTRFSAHGCVQVCVLAVRPVLPSHANQPQQPIGSSPVQVSELRRLYAHIVLPIRLAVSQNRPRRSCHLVGQGHCRHVGRSSCLNVFLPRRRHLGVSITISPVWASTQYIWNTRFATSNPYVVAFISGPPFLKWWSKLHFGTSMPFGPGGPLCY